MLNLFHFKIHSKMENSFPKIRFYWSKTNMYARGGSSESFWEGRYQEIYNQQSHTFCWVNQ